MLRHWKIIVSLAGIFVAGGVTGSMLTLHFSKRPQQAAAPNNSWLFGRLSYLEKRLSLTTEQMGKIRPMFERANSDLCKIRDESGKNVSGVTKKLNEDLARLLTSEQQTAFAQMQKEERERWEKFKQRSRGSGSRNGSSYGSRSPANATNNPPLTESGAVAPPTPESLTQPEQKSDK